MDGKTEREVVFRAIAEQEFYEDVAFYESRESGLGRRFEVAVNGQIQKILLAPEMFRRVRGEIRRAVLREFPYTIHFLVEPNRLVIVAVFHAKRNPVELLPRY
jgi:plasmid stabilization system protein ParE